MVAVVVAIAGVLSLLVQRRRPDAPTRTGYDVPDQLDRRDFAEPEAPWLVAVFTSATCNTCAATWEKARQLESAEVAVARIDVHERPDLHERYAIAAVPIIAIADADGVVRGSFIGPPTATDLWAAVAELRDPGSVPPGC